MWDARRLRDMDYRFGACLFRNIIDTFSVANRSVICVHDSVVIVMVLMCFA